MAYLPSNFWLINRCNPKLRNVFAYNTTYWLDTMAYGGAFHMCLEYVVGFLSSLKYNSSAKAT